MAAESNRIVSSETEELILVDNADSVQGYLSKAACHDDGGILHRAFSLFLFNERGQLLLQQRSPSKRLWPGFWSNSCCSHPRRGESMTVATQRRLRDELNLDAALEFVYKFQYQASFDDRGSEHELCHVFLGRITGRVRANAEEIAAIRFLSADELDAEFERLPGQFTPWFRMEWQTLRGEYADRVEEYLGPS